MKTIALSSGSASSRLVFWLVATMVVLGVVFAIIEIPRAPDRLAVAVRPNRPAPTAAASAAYVGAVKSDTGVPDASAVFRGRETPLEEPAPTF